MATGGRTATAANRWNLAAALSCSSGVIKPGSKYKRVKSKLSDFIHRPVILSQQVLGGGTGRRKWELPVSQVRCGNAFPSSDVHQRVGCAELNNLNMLTVLLSLSEELNV